MRILVVYNPHAGNGRARKVLPLIERCLVQHQIQADIKLTRHAGHAVDIVRYFPIQSVDAVVCCGGDGTLFEVVNGYYQNPASKKPPLGLIPNGTGNAFMKELGIDHGDFRRAIEIIAQRTPKALDVGRFDSQGYQGYFINMVGCGFVTEVATRAISWKWLGNAAYTVATLQKLIRLKAQTLQLEVDGKAIERHGVFAEVANSRYTGTRFLMAPRARLDDGKLDLVLLKNISRVRLLRLFTSIYDGSHVDYPEVEYIQAQKIRIVEQRPGGLIPDGEVLGATPVSFECLHRDIEFLWQ